MMISPAKLIAVLPLLVGCLGAGQGSTVPPKRRNDRQQEDAVAKLFDAVRKDAKLHRLNRIEKRISLQQLVCTVAVSGKVPRFRNGSPLLGNGSIDGATEQSQENGAPKADEPSALYRTSTPEELVPELKRVALYERPRGRNGHSPGYSRYSVAVWRAQEASNEKTDYWVAVQLFWSEGNEFFQYHFTDAMEWKNEWKQFVTAECKDIE